MSADLEAAQCCAVGLTAERAAACAAQGFSMEAGAMSASCTTFLASYCAQNMDAARCVAFVDPRNDSPAVRALVAAQCSTSLHSAACRSACDPSRSNDPAQPHAPFFGLCAGAVADYCVDANIDRDVPYKNASGERSVAVQGGVCRALTFGRLSYDNTENMLAYCGRFTAADAPDVCACFLRDAAYLQDEEARLGAGAAAVRTGHARCRFGRCAASAFQRPLGDVAPCAVRDACAAHLEFAGAFAFADGTPADVRAECAIELATLNAQPRTAAPASVRSLATSKDAFKDTDSAQADAVAQEESLWLWVATISGVAALLFAIAVVFASRKVHLPGTPASGTPLPTTRRPAQTPLTPVSPFMRKSVPPPL